MEKKKQITILLAFIPIALVVLVLVVLLAVFLIRVLWAWTIPAIFPNAVRQGLIVSSLSWFTGFKVLIAAVVISRIVGIRPEKRIKLGGYLDKKFEKFFPGWRKD
ncbi:MAG: hypothetical protein PVH61_16140 [Candidatus Aminicenantes bacterium]|jgi:hypothetical protein